jgi:nucleoside-diphosphate-sugar epimerase
MDDFEIGDVHDVEAMASRLDGVDAVLHLAAIPAPRQGSPAAIFDLNCAGTFCVFQACADAGVRRVAVASSLNAIGYYFGTVPFELDYLPVDESHARHTSDAYSFSKQITEDIGAYFWRREGVANACLRFGAGLRSLEEMMSELAPNWVAARQDVRQLADLPEAERRLEVDRMRGAYDGARRRRIMEEGGEWGSLSRGERRLMGLRHNYFSFVELNDACRGMELALTADYEGSHPLLIVDDRNCLCLEAAQLAALFYPDVALRRPLTGDEALVDPHRARQLIGFRAAVSATELHEPPAARS